MSKKIFLPPHEPQVTSCLTPDQQEALELKNDVSQLTAQVKNSESTVGHLRRVIQQLEQELKLAYTYIGAMTCQKLADESEKATVN